MGHVFLKDTAGWQTKELPQKDLLDLLDVNNDNMATLKRVTVVLMLRSWQTDRQHLNYRKMQCMRHTFNTFISSER